MLISIETHITCDFPGEVQTPYPPSGSAHVVISAHWVLSVLFYCMNFSVNLVVTFHYHYVFMVWIKKHVDPDQLASSEAS